MAGFCAQIARWILPALLTVGCNQSDFGDGGPLHPPAPDETPDGPGDSAWSSKDVSCQNTTDCAPSEACLDNICQMARCIDGPYNSSAPIGQRLHFFADREIIVADTDSYQGSYWIDGYLPTGSAVEYPSGGGSWNMSQSKILDVAGGNFLGEKPELFAVAVEGSPFVVIKKAGGTITINVGFQPIAISAGDVDHDSIDELIALSASGKFSYCNVEENTCKGFEFTNGVIGLDVAVTDIDGDGYEEPIFMLKNGDNTELIAWNVDHEESGEEQLVGASIATEYLSLTAGDIDGDGIGEVMTLEDGGWLGFAYDTIYIWRLGESTQQLGSVSVDADSIDITSSDLDSNGTEEVVLLYNTRDVEVFEGAGSTNLISRYTSELTVTQQPFKIAAADFDGNSPQARLINGPELIAGQPTPTMVLNFPPFSRSYSKGLPYLFVGQSDTSNEFYTDTVALRSGVQLGVGAEFPGIFSATMSVKLEREVRSNRMFQRDVTLGARFIMEPDTELHGNDYAVVILSSACFHAYTYELDDPDGIIGGHGGEFVMLVPLGGQTTMWSSPRYNAMAKAVGDLPIVPQGPEIGNPSTYPNFVAKQDGSPIPAEDIVFPDSPTFLTSDVGKVGWWLSVAERETNELAVYSELSVSAQVKVNGFSFGSSVTGGYGESIGLTLGDEALFGGAVPPIPDNPETPEDEYTANTFAFSPVIYREHYNDREGGDASYYVLSFSVGQ